MFLYSYESFPAQGQKEGLPQGDSVEGVSHLGVSPDRREGVRHSRHQATGRANRGPASRSTGTEGHAEADAEGVGGSGPCRSRSDRKGGCGGDHSAASATRARPTVNRTGDHTPTSLRRLKRRRARTLEVTTLQCDVAS